MQKKPEKYICKKCFVELPFTEKFFVKDKNRKFGLRYICRKCRNKKDKQMFSNGDKKSIEKMEKLNKYKREWARKNPDKERNSRLKYVFGITLDEYNQILREQNNVCAICGNKCRTGKNLAVDHDHSTNKIRGLLCDRCNFGIGSFDDDIEILFKAIEYLRRNKNE